MMWMFLLACVQPKSAQDFYLAEHGVWTFDPNDLCDSTSCRFDEVDEILDVVPEVEGVVEVVSIDPTLFTLRSLVVGDTLVSISGFDNGSDLVERYANIIVTPVHKFRMGLSCDVQEPSQEPWVIPVGTDVFAKWTTWDTSTNDVLGLPEFEAPGVTFSELDVYGQDVILKMPDEAGDIELTSPLFTEPVALFQVVTEEQYNGFDAYFWPDTSWPLEDTRRIETAVLVDEQSVCMDQLERIMTIMTPDICGFSDGVSTRTVVGADERVTVYSLSAGSCEVEISVPGLDLIETLAMTIE
ncbi:MAG: hypothetical protein CMK59_12925 [Proteobacteria bacterium]|nr:hypothetical protein [Pseudomonadota bacterium]